MTAKHPTLTAEYWEENARIERVFAEQKRSSRWATVESVRVHLRNADDYEAEARRLRALNGETVND